MNEIIIRIELENDAFQPYPGAEVKRIISEYILRLPLEVDMQLHDHELHQHPAPSMRVVRSETRSTALHDINGHRVGEVILKINED